VNSCELLTSNRQFPLPTERTSPPKEYQEIHKTIARFSNVLAEWEIGLSSTNVGNWTREKGTSVQGDDDFDGRARDTL
jgi:hypothetical protein